MACRCHEGDIFVPWLTCNASVACSSDDCGTWRERREDARLAQSLGRGLMSVPSESQHKVRFGAFELDLRTAELRKSGQELTLQGQPFQILMLLMDRPGELVTREELKKGLWASDTFVDFEHNLNKAVNRLREALGDSAEQPPLLKVAWSFLKLSAHRRERAGAENSGSSSFQRSVSPLPSPSDFSFIRAARAHSPKKTPSSWQTSLT